MEHGRRLSYIDCDHFSMCYRAWLCVPYYFTTDYHSALTVKACVECIPLYSKVYILVPVNRNVYYQRVFSTWEF